MSHHQHHDQLRDLSSYLSRSQYLNEFACVMIIITPCSYQVFCLKHSEFLILASVSRGKDNVQFDSRKRVANPLKVYRIDNFQSEMPQEVEVSLETNGQKIARNGSVKLTNNGVNVNGLKSREKLHTFSSFASSTPPRASSPTFSISDS